jgi:heme-degrading monooxygenase HmoA
VARLTEGEGVVYARVTVVQGSADKIEQGITTFNSEVLPTVKAVAGYKAAFLLADRKTGKGIGITLWESEDARRQGGEAVDPARASTIKAMGGTVPPVEEFEVVASDFQM